MSADRHTNSEVMCPLCGEYREPPNPIIGVVWAVMGCEQCKIKHDERARKLLTAAELLEEAS